MATIILTLPYPVSVNRIWRGSGKRVYRSPEYEAWIAQAGLQWMIQRPSQPKTIKGSYTLRIVPNRPDKRRRDLGNLEKVVSDFLQSAGIVEDDCLAERILLEWGPAGDGVLVEVSSV